MSTSAPIKRTWDIPIERPQRAAPSKEPLALPAPDPERWTTPFVREPAREPAKVLR